MEKWQMTVNIHTVDVVIDELTNCLVEVNSGKSFKTQCRALKGKISKNKAKKWIEAGWCFDWNKPQQEGLDIYELFVENDDVVQGRIALKNDFKGKFTYVHLVESAPVNRGENKKFLGVGGNLFAFACKLSFECGFDGFVQFVAKTSLVDHYKKTLNALLIDGQKMYINTSAALLLVQRYFPEVLNHAK